jgi:hypothetical protein
MEVTENHFDIKWEERNSLQRRMGSLKEIRSDALEIRSKKIKHDI